MDRFKKDNCNKRFHSSSQGIQEPQFRQQISSRFDSDFKGCVSNRNLNITGTQPGMYDYSDDTIVSVDNSDKRYIGNMDSCLYSDDLNSTACENPFTSSQYSQIYSNKFNHMENTKVSTSQIHALRARDNRPQKNIRFEVDQDLILTNKNQFISDVNNNKQTTNSTSVFKNKSNNSDKSLNLVAVSELPELYQPLFAQFPYFNIVQSTVFQDVFNSDESVVVSAPTGSGKTVIMELALIRSHFRSKNSKNFKVLYIAPLKAVVSERYTEWSAKLSILGLRCIEVTGDTDEDEYTDLTSADIILTTPEKLDSLTRRWKDRNSPLLTKASLLLVDEIHILSDSCRGPTLEAVVSRLKTIKATSEDCKNTTLRIVAVSATIPNVEDIAQWISANSEKPAVTYKLNESLRPVQLKKVVLGYHCPEAWSEYRFDISLTYKLASVINSYSERKPTLVFVNTRKGGQQTATTLMKQMKLVRNNQHRLVLSNIANTLKDSKLRDCVVEGVAFHHAGLDTNDRKEVEKLFIAGELPVLIATSTLAMGVNLPAHLVVIKSTWQYTSAGYIQYPASSVLQMVGRAGRPQFDTSATAVIMTTNGDKRKYLELVSGSAILESHLHQNLIEHINAEIVLNTVYSVSVAVTWLQSTFLYVRAQRNPKHYGLPTNLTDMIGKLAELCQREITKLTDSDLVLVDDEGRFISTPAGVLMARYCVSFNTMNSFLKLSGEESLKEVLNHISQCQEFCDVSLRTSEKKALNALNVQIKQKNANNTDRSVALRFPIAGKIKTRSDKISCLIQAILGCMSLNDPGLNQEGVKVMRVAQRLTKCLSELCLHRARCFPSGLHTLTLNALILTKSLTAKLWENSHYVTRQLERVGPALAGMLVKGRITSFTALEAVHPRDIEMICGRQPPFGNKLLEMSRRLPRYQMTIQQVGQIAASKCSLEVTLSLANRDSVSVGGSSSVKRASNSHSAILLIGDEDNNILCSVRVHDHALLTPQPFKRTVHFTKATQGAEVLINLVSETVSGVDVESEYCPVYSVDHRKADILELTVSPVSSQDQSMPNKRECYHSCSDKQLCGHMCCKRGVVGVMPRKLSESSLLNPMNKRVKLMPSLPSKDNLKASATEKIVDPNLSRFAFKSSKPKMEGKQTLPDELKLRLDEEESQSSDEISIRNQDNQDRNWNQSMAKSIESVIANRSDSIESTRRNSQLNNFYQKENVKASASVENVNIHHTVANSKNDSCVMNSKFEERDNSKESDISASIAEFYNTADYFDSDLTVDLDISPNNETSLQLPEGSSTKNLIDKDNSFVVENTKGLSKVESEFSKSSCLQRIQEIGQKKEKSVNIANTPCTKVDLEKSIFQFNDVKKRLPPSNETVRNVVSLVAESFRNDFKGHEFVACSPQVNNSLDSSLLIIEGETAGSMEGRMEIIANMSKEWSAMRSPRLTREVTIAKVRPMAIQGTPMSVDSYKKKRHFDRTLLPNLYSRSNDLNATADDQQPPSPINTSFMNKMKQMGSSTYFKMKKSVSKGIEAEAESERALTSKRKGASTTTRVDTNSNSGGPGTTDCRNFPPVLPTMIDGQDRNVTRDRSYPLDNHENLSNLREESYLHPNTKNVFTKDLTHDDPLCDYDNSDVAIPHHHDVNEIAMQQDQHASYIDYSTSMPHDLNTSDTAMPHNLSTIHSAMPHNLSTSPAAMPHNLSTSHAAMPHNLSTSHAAMPHNLSTSHAAMPHNLSTSHAAMPHNISTSHSGMPHNLSTSHAAMPHNISTSHSGMPYNLSTNHAAIPHNLNASYSGMPHDLSISGMPHDLNTSYAGMPHDLNTSYIGMPHDLNTSYAGMPHDLNISPFQNMPEHKHLCMMQNRNFIPVNSRKHDELSHSTFLNTNLRDIYNNPMNSNHLGNVEAFPYQQIPYGWTQNFNNNNHAVYGDQCYGRTPLNNMQQLYQLYGNNKIQKDASYDYSNFLLQVRTELK